MGVNKKNNVAISENFISFVRKKIILYEKKTCKVKHKNIQIEK